MTGPSKTIVLHSNAPINVKLAGESGHGVGHLTDL